MTLTEFLLARIAEDEADARYLMVGLPPAKGGPYTIDHPARVLAECEAKREVIRQMTDYFGPYCGEDAEAAGLPISLFAAVYADHDDYEEAWKP